MEVMLRGDLQKLAWLESFVESRPQTNRLMERLVRRGVKKAVIEGNDQYQQVQEQADSAQQSAKPNVIQPTINTQGVVVNAVPAQPIRYFDASIYGPPKVSIQTR